MALIAVDRTLAETEYIDQTDQKLETNQNIQFLSLFERVRKQFMITIMSDFISLVKCVLET